MKYTYVNLIRLKISVNVRYSRIMMLLAMAAAIISYKIFGHRKTVQSDSRTSGEV